MLDVRHVPRAQEAVVRKRLLGRLFVVEVPFHDLGAADQQLPRRACCTAFCI